MKIVVNLNFNNKTINIRRIVDIILSIKLALEKSYCICTLLKLVSIMS